MTDPFKPPEHAANINALGLLRLPEAIRVFGYPNRTRFYQASSAEMYDLDQEVPQKETMPFYPRNPYSVVKLYTYWIVVSYRESYGMYASNRIMFSRELSKGLIKLPNALRILPMDWGHV